MNKIMAEYRRMQAHDRAESYKGMTYEQRRFKPAREIMARVSVALRPRSLLVPVVVLALLWAIGVWTLGNV